MDWYFIVFIVSFCMIAILMLIFAFNGPTCTDDEDSNNFNALNGKGEKAKTTCHMPLPQELIERRLHRSSTSPYPPNPPPLGFGNILSSSEHTCPNSGQFSYPLEEEISRMPFPISSMYSLIGEQSNTTPQPPETPVARTRVVAPRSIRHNEPPPPYSEVAEDSVEERSIRNRRKRPNRLSQ